MAGTNKMNKTAASLIVMLMVMGTTSVLAAWSLTSTSNFTATVIGYSDTPMEFTIPFNAVELNTSTSTDSENSIAKFLNSGTNSINLIVDINETVSDVADDCTYEDDCTTTYKYDGILALVDGQMIGGVGSGNHTITANTSCERFSCPSTLDKVVTLTVV